jgi:nitrogen regulatory protein PII
MSHPLETAKLKLVTVIATSELEDRLMAALRKAGASGYTISGVSEGGGSHGPRHRGMFDTGNVRIEMLVSAEVARKMLEVIVAGYPGMSVVAFAQDVEAVPRKNFVPC